MRKCVLLLLALLLALPTAALADDTQFIEHAPFALDDTCGKWLHPPRRVTTTIPSPWNRWVL